MVATAPTALSHQLDLDALYRGYRRRAYAIAWAFLHDENDADDAVQEAFMKAKRSAATFNGVAQPQTWMNRIVVNVCRDLKRHRRRRPEHHVDDVDVLEPLQHTDASPEAALASIELRDALHEGLQRLSHEHREAIIGREVGGLDYQQLATAGGCPTGTVMSRLFHARRKLRSWLGRRLELGSSPARPSARPSSTPTAARSIVGHVAARPRGRRSATHECRCHTAAPRSIAATPSALS